MLIVFMILLFFFCWMLDDLEFWVSCGWVVVLCNFGCVLFVLVLLFVVWMLWLVLVVYLLVVGFCYIIN